MEVIAEFDAEEIEDDDTIANFLSDTYGFCVNSYAVKYPVEKTVCAMGSDGDTCE